MLLETFYSIRSQNLIDDVLATEIVFNELHEVYDGHFPDNPITPGVCILQTAKQILEDYLGKKLQIDQIHNVKFLQIIRPDSACYYNASFNFLNSSDFVKKVSISIKDQNGKNCLKAIISYNVL
jgi:3-hydroxyacyl-[acyl-carrier-protein] dehydratase